MIEGKLKDLLTFHHIGIAVRDFKKSVQFYSSLGYVSSELTTDTFHNVEIVMLSSDLNPDIELVKPLNEGSPVSNFLKKNEERIYHICYEVSNLQTTLEVLKRTHRVICVSKKGQAVVFEGKEVSFYFISGVGIVEFLEK